MPLHCGLSYQSPPLGRTSFAIRLISFNMSSDVIILWLYDCQNGNIHACKANKYFIRKRGAYTKKAPAFDCKCLIFFWSSGSQDVSVATPWLLLILTCSAGACYPRKRHGLNLLWNQICCPPCLSACRLCLYPIESKLSWSPALYGRTWSSLQATKNTADFSAVSFSCSGSQD